MPKLWLTMAAFVRVPCIPQTKLVLCCPNNVFVIVSNWSRHIFHAGNVQIIRTNYAKEGVFTTGSLLKFSGLIEHCLPSLAKCYWKCLSFAESATPF